MSSAPLPSKLTLLSSLPLHNFGDKVRFLGWYAYLALRHLGMDYLKEIPCLVICSDVTSYSMASATLTLSHQFPKLSNVEALVDVRLLLERLTAEQTSVGEWVNIIGYISSAPPAPVEISSRRKVEAPAIHVQALMLWSAGPLEISRYENHLGQTLGNVTPKAKQSKLGNA